jgi:hypothetical protein
MHSLTPAIALYRSTPSNTGGVAESAAAAMPTPRAVYAQAPCPRSLKLRDMRAISYYDSYDGLHFDFGHAVGLSQTLSNAESTVLPPVKLTAQILTVRDHPGLPIQTF